MSNSIQKDYSDAILTVCPQAFNEYLGKQCSLHIESKLVIFFDDTRIETSIIISTELIANILTVKTSSGSVYNFQI